MADLPLSSMAPLPARDAFGRAADEGPGVKNYRGASSGFGPGKFLTWYIR